MAFSDYFKKKEQKIEAIVDNIYPLIEFTVEGTNWHEGYELEGSILSYNFYNYEQGRHLAIYEDKVFLFMKNNPSWHDLDNEPITSDFQETVRITEESFSDSDDLRFPLEKVIDTKLRSLIMAFQEHSSREER